MYSENDYRNYLQHEGILGMKWGKRNGPPYPLSLGKHSAAEKKKMKPSLKEKLMKIKRDRYNKKHKDIYDRRNDTESYSKDSLKDLTDKEIKDRMDRMALEKKYLDSLPTSSTEKGRRIISEILANSGKKAAEQLATAALVYGGKQVIKQFISEDAYKEMFGGKGKDKKKEDKD